MTLILGIEDPANDRAIVAYDSAVTRGGRVETVRDAKAWRSNGWIAGLSGQVAFSQLAREIPMAFLPSRTVEQAAREYSREVTRQFGGLIEAVKRADPGAEWRSPEMILARGQRVWLVLDSEATSTEAGYAAVGCPDEATAALKTVRMLRPEWQALEQARAVFSVICGMFAAVGGPIHWMGTDGSNGTF